MRQFHGLFGKKEFKSKPHPVTWHEGRRRGKRDIAAALHAHTGSPGSGTQIALARKGARASGRQWGVGRQREARKRVRCSTGRCSARGRLASAGGPCCHRGHGWFEVLPHQYGRTAVASPGGRYHLHTFHLRFFLSLKPQAWTICMSTHEPCVSSHARCPASVLPLTRNIRDRKSHQHATPIVSAARWFEATAH